MAPGKRRISLVRPAPHPVPPPVPPSATTDRDAFASSSDDELAPPPPSMVAFDPHEGWLRPTEVRLTQMKAAIQMQVKLRRAREAKARKQEEEELRIKRKKQEEQLEVQRKKQEELREKQENQRKLQELMAKIGEFAAQKVASLSAQNDAAEAEAIADSPVLVSATLTCNEEFSLEVQMDSGRQTVREFCKVFCVQARVPPTLPPRRVHLLKIVEEKRVEAEEQEEEEDEEGAEEKGAEEKGASGKGEEKAATGEGDEKEETDGGVQFQDERRSPRETTEQPTEQQARPPKVELVELDMDLRLCDYGIRDGAKLKVDVCQYIVTGSQDGSAKIWVDDTGECVLTLKGHKVAHAVHAACFSPDSQTIVTASEDGTARLWDAQSGECIGVLEGHEGEVYVAVFSPDGRYVATGAEDCSAKLWSTETCECLHTLPNHRSSVVLLQFMPDGKHIATSARDGRMLYWSLKTGIYQWTDTRQDEPLYVTSLSPDGRSFVAIVGDDTAKVYNFATSELLLLLRGHRDIVVTARYATPASMCAQGATVEKG